MIPGWDSCEQVTQLGENPSMSSSKVTPSLSTDPVEKTGHTAISFSPTDGTQRMGVMQHQQQGHCKLSDEDFMSLIQQIVEKDPPQLADTLALIDPSMLEILAINNCNQSTLMSHHQQQQHPT